MDERERTAIVKDRRLGNRVRGSCGVFAIQVGEREGVPRGHPVAEHRDGASQADRLQCFGRRHPSKSRNLVHCVQHDGMLE
jgi:hypothetical protein